MNVTDPLSVTAAHRPGEIAVITADHESLSYARIDGLVDAMAVRLERLGLVRGDVVGVAVAGVSELPGLVAVLALARLGIASAERSVPSALLTMHIAEGMSAVPADIPSIRIEQLWNGLVPGAARCTACTNPEAILRLVASSGTTGRPKVAAMSHAAMALRQGSARLQTAHHGPVRVIAHSLASSSGLRSVLGAFSEGATIVLTDPANAAQAIRRHRVSSITISPFSLQNVLGMLADNAKPPPDLRTINVSGAPLPVPLRMLARRKLCANLVGSCGSMECGRIAVALMSDTPGYAGQLLAGVQAQTLDRAGQVLPCGAEGLLRYRTPGMMQAYIGDPALSAEMFRVGWFYSGDIGRVGADGLLTLLGRDRDVINMGGVKVSPLLIEDVLLGIPGVTEAAAFGVPDAEGLDRIWAAVVATRRIPDSEFNTVCNEKLAGRVPTVIAQLDRLPRNEAGKILRGKLAEDAASLPGSMRRTEPGRL